MVGIGVWLVSSVGLALGLQAAGVWPMTHPASYAAAMPCTLAGMGLGTAANGYIRDRWPKFDRWSGGR